jgi:ribonuclease HI
VINSVTKWMRGWKAKGWRKADGKPVMNLELLQELDAALTGRHYRFEWVKGHVGHVLNEAADSRARAAAEAYQQAAEPAAGPGFTDATDAPAPVVIRAAQPPAAPVPAAEASSGSPETAQTKPRSVAVAEPLSLFDLDADADEPETLALSLSRAEHTRLLQRARGKGISAEELLRSLI